MVCKATDLNSVRELVPVKDFTNCLPEHIVVYLNEKKGLLTTAATLPVEFTFEP